jgi:hypothetical protein
MKYIYLLFTIIIIYLLYINYINNLNQENFDPSFVPVSSIIKLAKIGQTMINGNGTLTNPSNLQIGIPSAPGNLYVTGKNTINGTSTFNNNLSVNGNTTFVGNNTLTGTQHTVNGNSIINNGLNITGSLTTNTGDVNARTNDANTRLGKIWSLPGIYAEGTNNLEIGSGSKNVYIGSSDNTVKNNLIITGNSQINGNYTVNGNSTINGKNIQISNTSVNRVVIPSEDPWIARFGGRRPGVPMSDSPQPEIPPESRMYVGDGTGWRLRFGHRNSTTNNFVPSVDINDTGNLTAYGNIYTKNGRNLVDDLYKNIKITAATYASSYTGGGDGTAKDALTRASWGANQNGSFKFQYMPGTTADGGRYDTHGGFAKTLNVTYTCGIGGVTKTKTVSGGEGANVTIDCSDAL